MGREFNFALAVDQMKQLTHANCINDVEWIRNEQSVPALLEFLEKVKKIWHSVPFEMMTGGLIVRHYVGSASAAPESSGGCILSDSTELSGHSLQSLTVELQDSGHMRIWPEADLSTGFADIPGFVYRYTHVGVEEIFLDGERLTVPKSPWSCSLGVPTYTRLENVLTRYIELTRRPEACAHIAKTWRDDKRLAFLQQPEHHLRRSLSQILRYSLEGAVVRQEQRQDETKPVDIEITWWSPGRSAIIEVKWMGHSGPRDRAQWSTSYGHGRAREGLAQVCDYLDRRHGSTPNVPVYGYIFVFDARRDNITPTSSTVSREDGLRYQFEDIEYPAELLARPDVGQPFRCFLEPVTD